MLCGRTPYQSPTVETILGTTFVLQREPEPLDIGALPADLARIVSKMLAKNLEARYSTITEVAGDLKSLQKRIDFEAEL